MKRFFIITQILICLFINIYGQNSKLDSLWKEYKKAKHDTRRIKLFLDIGDVYEYQASDTALIYYQKALDLTDKNLASPPTTLPQTVDAFALLKANSLRYIGIVHASQDNYDKAIEYYLKSLKIDEELQDKNGIVACYINIGSLNTTLADSAALSERQRLNYLNIAVEYASKGIELTQKIEAMPRENEAANTLMNAYIFC
ncbi:MAG: tetratricopeptide repeat protein [Bacteroidia bacterium]|nr:tetratricopeptide repeat protein [Bacteroidia bacterium]